MSGKFRFASVVLIATLMVVAGCSMLMSRASGATFPFPLASRHEQGGCSNFGTMTIEGKTYSLPSNLAAWYGETYQIRFDPPPGCVFVRWEVTGTANTVKEPNAQATELHVDYPGTLTAVFKGTCCSVGGVVVPASIYLTLTPYLAVIGLVAVGAAVYITKRKR